MLPEILILQHCEWTLQVFAESNDGTRVPMFIVSQKSIQQNKQNPTLLYGYGGSNFSETLFKGGKSNFDWLFTLLQCLRGMFMTKLEEP